MRYSVKLQIIGIYILIIIITSCKDQDSALQIPELAKVEAPSYVIIPFDTNNLVLKRFINGSKKVDLDKEEISKVEELLTVCILKYNNDMQKEFETDIRNIHSSTQNYDDYIINLYQYKKQFVPVLNSKGEKEVWINCFCVYDRKNWKKKIFTAMDGGKCFFNLKINLTTQKCYDLHVNGEA